MNNTASPHCGCLGTAKSAVAFTASAFTLQIVGVIIANLYFRVSPSLYSTVGGGAVS